MADSKREQTRVRLLHALHLLDGSNEPLFDHVTRVLARALDVPSALVSLIDMDVQWFKSRYGETRERSPLSESFCVHALTIDEPLIVPDALQDPTFHAHPAVVGGPRVRFYAGAQIRSLEGHALGTLCAFDTRPRVLSVEQRAILLDLAGIITHDIQMREAALLSRQELADADAETAAAEDRFKTIFDTAGAGIALLTPEGEWLDANAPLAQMLGYTREALMALPYAQLRVEEDEAERTRLLRRLMRKRIRQFEQEKRFRRRDGSLMWGQVTVTSHCDACGRLDYFVVVIKNIDARKAVETELAELNQQLEARVQRRTEQLRNREAELSAVLEHTHDAYVCTDEQGVITAWNRMAEVTFGWTRAEAIGRLMSDLLIPPDMRAAHQQGMVRYLDSREGRILGQRIELPALCKDGRVIPVEAHINALTCGERISFNAFLHEISARKQVEQKREREALQDALTGLPNRRAMLEALPAAMARVAAERQPLALMFIDLDGFKKVNDTLGHDAGDDLLREIASRLRASLRSQDAVFRLAGDEFTVLLSPISGLRGVTPVADKLLAVVDAPVLIQDNVAHVQASIGIALYYPDDPRTLEQLIKDADAAMYDAKRGGRNQYQIRRHASVNQA